jgi:hypothetical protein
VITKPRLGPLPDGQVVHVAVPDVPPVLTPGGVPRAAEFAQNTQPSGCRLAAVADVG